MKTHRFALVLLIWFIGAWDCNAQVNKFWIDEARSNLAMEENLLFYNLDPLLIADLQPGDILLKKDYGRYASTSPVIKAQRMYKADHASRFTSHTMLFVGANNTAPGSNSDIAESIALTPGGVVLRSLSACYGPGRAHPVGACVLVYRCADTRASARAVQTALRHATDGWPQTVPAISYSYTSCLGTFVGSPGYFVLTAHRNVLPGTAKNTPLKKMMCSEFVIFCYQNGFDVAAARIQLDAARTAPIRLEEYLNSSENFQLMGRLSY